MQSRPSTEPGLITALHPISVRSPTMAPNFVKPVAILPSVAAHRDFAVIQFHIRENHARAKVRAVTEN